MNFYLINFIINFIIEWNCILIMNRWGLLNYYFQLFTVGYCANITVWLWISSVNKLNFFTDDLTSLGFRGHAITFNFKASFSDSPCNLLLPKLLLWAYRQFSPCPSRIHSRYLNVVSNISKEVNTHLIEHLMTNNSDSKNKQDNVICIVVFPDRNYARKEPMLHLLSAQR